MLHPLDDGPIVFRSTHSCEGLHDSTRLPALVIRKIHIPGISVTNDVDSVSVHLETLRLYCDVVRLRSFRAAPSRTSSPSRRPARPSSSSRRSFGVGLIDRTKRPFVITREGEAFYDAAPGHLESWEKAKTEVAAVKARWTARCGVAAIYSVACTT